MPIINTQIKGQGGVQPSGTISIQNNGTYDITNYAAADVQVPSTAPSFYIQRAKSGSVTNKTLVADKDAPIMNFSDISYIQDFILARGFYNNYNTVAVDLSNVKTINSYGCYQCFTRSYITSVNLSSLTSIGYNGCCEMFSGCVGITGSVNISSLTNIINASACFNMFQGCTGITSVDLSSLSMITGTSACYYMFQGCTGITSVDLSSLTTINASQACYFMFANCSSLTNLNMSSLQSISGSTACSRMFRGCTSLINVDLSGLTNVNGELCMELMFSNCTNLRTVDLRNLTTVSGRLPMQSTFSGCTNLQSIIINDNLVKRNPVTMFAFVPVQTCMYEPMEYQAMNNTGDGICQGQNFRTANMYAFEMCNSSFYNVFKDNTALEEIKFPVLARWNGANNATGFLQGCTNANFTDVYFPMLCVFRNAVPFTTTSFPSQVTIHFRKDQQSLIESTSGASSAFGGAALVFDQIGTITVGGVNYIRQGKCNETGYYAWQRASSNITVGGVVYTFDISQITRNTNPDIAGPILYGWTNSSTTIYTDSLKPQVGDYIWTAFNVAQSTTPVDAVDNEFIYTVDSAEPDVGDTVYSDAQGTVLGTIDAVA